jgi:hypothetical protein
LPLGLGFVLVEGVTLAGETIKLPDRPLIDRPRIDVESVGDHDHVSGDAFGRSRPWRQRAPMLLL